jgi:hypothetical protein
MTTQTPDPVRVLHTLGPTGTNCEAAAHHWFEKHGIDGRVVLHDTLEAGVEAMRESGEHAEALLGCVVYPDLNTLVFANLEWLQLTDCFVMPTFNMVVASADGSMPTRVATHPAPKHLVPRGCEYAFVNSNAVAAASCASGDFDGCVTTLAAARLHKLEIVRDFGAVPMGFSIHAKY